MFEFEIYVDKDGQYRFHPVGLNHEIIGDNYTRLDSAKDGVRLMKKGAADAKVFIRYEDGTREEISL